MRHVRTALAVALLGTIAGRAAAQQRASDDSIRAEIRQTLRAFYFNLAHRDWEALTSDILAAKVVAHRTPPPMPPPAASVPSGCEKSTEPLIDRATIELTDPWAQVLVPRCPGSIAPGDRFRLIHFEQHWRFVAIDLWEDPVKLWAER